VKPKLRVDYSERIGIYIPHLGRSAGME
jgi:hypothetical protein